MLQFNFVIHMHAYCTLELDTMAQDLHTTYMYYLVYFDSPFLQSV